MRLDGYFGRGQEHEESAEERAVLIKQLEDLLIEATKKQSDLALIISRNREVSSGEDSKRLFRQLQTLEDNLNKDRTSLNTSQLEQAIDEMQNVVENLDRHISTYRESLE
ncbi:MAG: hypothetical protein BWY19_01031 [bacterium ADurb.Bin212]|nr:MAG: hypothetical protein BWY19_01031 [bacterium ADurb.Bin212]